MSAKQRFEYRGRSAESISRKTKRIGGGYDSYLRDDVTFFKAKEGENTVRILPPTWEDVEKWGDGWEIVVYVHFNIGADGGSFLCLDKMKGEPCPICEARAKAADEDEAKELKWSARPIAWVIDRSDEKAGPVIWGIPINVFKDINVRSVDKKTSTPVLIDHPDDGYDISFSREGTKMENTKYLAIEVSREPSSISEKDSQYDKWLDYIEANPLPDLLEFKDYDYIKRVLHGKVDRSNKEEEETEEDASRSSRRGRSRSEPDVIEGEEDNSSRRSSQSSRKEEVEEEEEEAQPSRTSARRRELLNDPEDDPPSERGRRRGRGEEAAEEEPEPETRRSRSRSSKEAEDEEQPDQERVVGRARQSLERLKRRT